MIFQHETPLFEFKGKEQLMRVVYQKQIYIISSFEIRKDKTLVVGGKNICLDIFELNEDQRLKLRQKGFEVVFSFFERIEVYLSDKQKKFIDDIYQDDLKQIGFESFF